jgi:hypothetical protein
MIRRPRHVRLPLADAFADVPSGFVLKEETTSMAPAATAVRTLIVEDDFDAADALAGALAAEGFDPSVASTVGQALIKLEAGLLP